MTLYNKYYSQFEYGFFAGSTLGVLASSCVGGIAAMAVLENGTSPVQLLQLFLVVAFSMIFNGSVLSQQTPKTVFNCLLLSLSMNTLLAIINFAMHHA